jgi:hypothetical protein
LTITPRNFAEKISIVADRIAAINLLPDQDRATDALLFSPRSRHAARAGRCFIQRFSSRDDRSAGAKGTRKMRQLRSLLRAAPSRIGRRIAQIVAIAAASLPAAGA